MLKLYFLFLTLNSFLVVHFQRKSKNTNVYLTWIMAHKCHSCCNLNATVCVLWISSKEINIYTTSIFESVIHLMTENVSILHTEMYIPGSECKEMSVIFTFHDIEWWGGWLYTSLISLMCYVPIMRKGRQITKVGFYPFVQRWRLSKFLRGKAISAEI